MTTLSHHRTPLDTHGLPLPIFEELAALRIWTAWRIGAKRADGRFSKPPIACRIDGFPNDRCSGERWSNPENHVPLAEAVAFASEHALSGVGIVLGPWARDLNLIVGDLDHALENGRALPWARAIVAPDDTPAVYCETSPSRTGVRFIGKGCGSVASNRNGVELFDGRAVKFATVTGAWWPKTPGSLIDAPAVIDAALARAGAGGSFSQGEATAPTLSRAALQAVTPPLADLSRDTLQSALAAVPVVELAYDEWIKVGHAIHHQTGGDAEGAEMWHDWSALDDGRYDPDICEEKWRSFGKPRKGAPVTAKHALKLAQARGWVQPQRDPTSALGVTDDAESWPAPGNLGGGADALPSESWITGTLPPALENYTSNVAARIGADATAVRALMLPLMGALAPAAISYEPRGDAGWRVPLTFFVALVGPPGSVKTPIISSLSKPVEQAEADWRRDHKAAEARHKRESTRSKDEDATAVPSIRPKLRRRTTTSATIEGHARLVERTSESIITLTDELQTFLGGLDKFTGVGATGSSDRAYWLSGYEGKAYHSDRADPAKCISVGSVKASVVGGIQPRVLGAALTVLTSDGLAQRFLWVPTGTARMSEDVPPDNSGAAIYGTACRLILDAAEGALGPIVLTADADAKAVSFDAERFGIKAAESLPQDDPLRDIAAKSRGFAARLTAALHVIGWAVRQAEDLALGLIDDPEPLPVTVTGETAEDALRIWQAYYWPAAVRTYRGATEAATARDVADLAAFVTQLDAGRASFTATDACNAVNRFRGKGRPALDTAARALERAHWLRRREQTGGTKWMINPALRRAT